MAGAQDLGTAWAGCGVSWVLKAAEFSTDGNRMGQPFAGCGI